MITDIEIGQHVRKLRLGRGLSQLQVANHTGVSESHVSNVENGRTSVKHDWLRSFCKLVGIGYLKFFVSKLPELSSPSLEQLGSEHEDLLLQNESSEPSVLKEHLIIACGVREYSNGRIGLIADSTELVTGREKAVELARAVLRLKGKAV